MTSSLHRVPPLPAAGRPDLRSGSGSTAAAYHSLLVAASIASTVVAPEAIAWTLSACAAAWGVLSLAFRPGFHTAGNGIMLAVTTSLLVRNYAGLGWEARGWASLTLVVLAAPFVLAPLGRTPGFPFLHLWCLFEGLYVYVSSLLSVPLAVHASFYTHEVRTSGYRVLALFTVVLVGGGLVTLGALRRTANRLHGDAPAAPPPPAAIPRAYLLAVGAFVAVTMAERLGVDDRIGQLAQVLRAIGLGGGLMLALLWIDGRLAVRHRLVLGVATTLFVLAGLGNGALYLSAIPGLLVLALWVGHRRRVPFIALFAATIVLVTLNVGKSDFRQDTLYSDRLSGSTTTLGLSWIQRTVDDLARTTDIEIQNSANRFANSDLLGYVATWAPERFPYSGFATYTRIPTLFVPRLLVPSKGSFNVSNEFGRQYELISQSDRNTAVNTPLHVEAQVAGGTQVLAVVALLSGTFMALLGRVLRAPDAATTITAALVALQVMSTIESGVLGFALVIPFILVLRPIMRWACDGPRRRRQRRGTALPRPTPAAPVPASPDR